MRGEGGSGDPHHAASDILSALRCDSLRYGDCRYPARLRADDARGAARSPGALKEVLRHLRGFPAARLSSDDHNLVVFDRRDDL